MATQLTDEALDTLLALQIAVAWAGEGRCDPPRLGWWETDLVDPEGGGDFLARLLPKTHAWVALEAVREAARRVDAKARAKLAQPDAVRTLFFLGFEVDEQLADRLADHKHGGTPTTVLPLPVDPSRAFSRDAFSQALGTGNASVTVVPGGRLLKGKVPGDPVDAVRNLAAALLPLADEYPMPFYRIDGAA